jgi:Ser/Thr protein kinase RdoA (MazF antagonist)
MMKLSTMKKVVDTVDGEWRSPLAENILERWGYDPRSVYYFRASANFLFIFKQKGKTYFLRFSDSCEKDLLSLKSEIEILEYLRNQPLRVALPVKSLNENHIEVVETEIGTFYAVVFEALPGQQFETDELQQDQFFKWGSTLGELHTILKGIPERYRLNRKSWKDQLALVKEFLPDHEHAAIEELGRLKAWSNELSITNENFGLIHYDFELDNQRWDHSTIGILDFDDCLNHWFVADIAFALRDLLKADTNLEIPQVQEFIKGYRSATELDSSLIQQLQMFIRMHNLIMFVGLLKTVDVPESQDHPEWLSNLRGKLIHYIDQYRQSFEQLSTGGLTPTK